MDQNFIFNKIIFNHHHAVILFAHIRATMKVVKKQICGSMFQMLDALVKSIIKLAIQHYAETNTNYHIYDTNFNLCNTNLKYIM